MRSLKMVAAAAMLMASINTMSAQEKGGQKKGGGPPPMIKIKIAAFPDLGRIPEKFACTAKQGSLSPAISWSGGAGTPQSYVLIMHDPDPVIGASTTDVLHWAVIDIPGNATSLPEGMKAGDQANGSKQIDNIVGMPSYLGPCPPPGHGDHHYTFELYALSAKLGLPAATNRADLLKAMNGKVLSKGVYIGMFGRK
jgi:Raf kinase inhibitor-like YbhB/YbcL family protein